MKTHFLNWFVSSFLWTFLVCSPTSAAAQEVPSGAASQEAPANDDSPSRSGDFDISQMPDLVRQRILERHDSNGDGELNEEELRSLRSAGDRARSGRRGFSRLNNASEKDLELFLEVVGELSPGVRDSLVELRANDPEAFRKSVVQQGRRIWNLVQLRVTNRDLYDLKIALMAIQRQLNSLAASYRDAAARGAAEEAAGIRADLKKVAVEHVDLEMRVRGEELAAMAEALEKLRKELLAAATERTDRVKALLEEVTSPRSGADEEGQGAPRRGLLREFSGSSPELGSDASQSGEDESPAGR